MPPIRNLSTWFGATAVRLGSLWVQGRNVEESLARYTKLIFCLTGSQQHPYSLVGSATGVRKGGKCFLFCCRHQIKQFSPDEVTIPVDKSGKILISGSQFIWIERDEQNNDEEYPDLCAMIYDAEKYGEPNLEFSFFEFIERDCWRGDRTSQFYLYGYPSSLRNVDYDTPHIAVKQIVVSAKYSGQSFAAGLHRIEMARTAKFSSDGLSGGPVFHVGRDQRGFYMGLAGIIMRGSDTSNYIHFMDARFLSRFLEKVAA